MKKIDPKSNQTFFGIANHPRESIFFLVCDPTGSYTNENLFGCDQSSKIAVINQSINQSRN